MSNSSTAPDGNLGRRLLGQYVLVEKLGEGGMGSVYLAEQPTVGRRAVVKLLHPQLSRDPDVAARFNLEARAAAALNHPHIVTVYNYGADGDGTLFLAMEHLDGVDLERAILDAGRLPAARAVHVARQICDALAEAHARGVVHRDLKPSNVMLVTRGRDRDFVKVLDFGIAKVRGVALTHSGMVFGTPEYMSPEQLRGQELDGRSDLYALGVTLFEMLTGRVPFAGETPAEVMTAQLEALPPAPSAVAPDAQVPPELDALVARTLAKDRAARPASAEELEELLAAAIGEAGATAVGGKRSDPPGRARRVAPVDRRSIGMFMIVLAAIAGIVLLVVMRKSTVDSRQPTVRNTETAPTPKKTPTPTPTPMPTPTAPSETSDDGRSLEELERELLTMKSPLRASDRRAALRALYARIDAGGGSADERAKKKRRAVAELIRQHAN